jgi:putative N6-adenine-specific DNA methylase
VATCAPGIELLLENELRALLATAGNAAPNPQIRRTPGGIEFCGKMADGYRANLCLRTANRVLLRIIETKAHHPSKVVKKLRKVPWETLFHPGQPVRLETQTHRFRRLPGPPLEVVLKDAIRTRFAQLDRIPPTFDAVQNAKARQLLFLRLSEQTVTVSLDSSGALLHKRGYRTSAHRAPIRETLAAALLGSAGYAPTVFAARSDEPTGNTSAGGAPAGNTSAGGALAGTPPTSNGATAPPVLVDAMTGAGTLAIEAALLARRIPPGCNRTFAFEHWPSFRPRTWKHIQKSAARCILPAAPHPIFGRDRDAATIKDARANSRRAGVENDIEWQRADFFTALPPPTDEPGLIVCNPPYGRRLPPDDSAQKWAVRFGKRMRSAWPGWRYALVIPGGRWSGYLDLPIRTRHTWPHGGLKISVLCGTIPAL